MLDVRRLIVLREIAATGSVSAAAQSLSFTPSAISQQIAALERETGVPLLERDGRGIRLTDAAHALVRRADVILAELRRAESDLEAVKDAAIGSLSIGAFPSSGTLLVPTALKALTTTHPGVDVRLTELEPEESLPMLQDGRLDLTIAFECDLVPLAHRAFEEETLFREPMLVAHAPSKFGQAEAIDLRRLRGESWIAPRDGTAIHEFTIRACQVAGFEPLVTSTWSDFQVVQSLAAQGYGVAFIPRLALDPARPGVVARRTTRRLERRVFAAWREGNSRAPLVTAALVALRAAAATCNAFSNI